MKTMFTILLLMFISTIKGGAPMTSFTKPNYVLLYEYLEKIAHEEFLYHLALTESSNQLSVVNEIGAMGLWQMMPATLRSLEVDTAGFLQDSVLQRQAVEKLIDTNRCQLSEIISQHDSTTFNGIFITEYAILAAAHLAGARGVKNYFEGGPNKKDANGTSIEHYLEKFN